VLVAVDPLWRLAVLGGIRRGSDRDGGSVGGWGGQDVVDNGGAWLSRPMCPQCWWRRRCLTRPRRW